MNCKNIFGKDIYITNNYNALLMEECVNCNFKNIHTKECWDPIRLNKCDNIKISECTLEQPDMGMRIQDSHNCKISKCSLIDCEFCGMDVSGTGNHLFFNEISAYEDYSGHGIALLGGGTEADNNLVMGNYITGFQEAAIWVIWSKGNTLKNNDIVENDYAFSFHSSYDNVLHHNNIVDNWRPFMDWYYSFEDPNPTQASNTWEDGKGEGNYWSDYEGEDTDEDGVGDTDLPHNGVDYYPLMKKLRGK
ncbi:MAG: right-handed parallel beta-helix repeat-containing protein [Candidatus Thermoplasmatota archaeon]|nr:right-handed parallel beta-helix repeat-containing protein [Candidatus Thermoplasmatota archaeon]